MSTDVPPSSRGLPLAAGAVALPGGELWAQARLALPLAAQQVGMQLMGAVDTGVLGHYSADGLAGAGVGAGVVFTIACVAMGVLMGLDAVMPRAVGAGDGATVDRALRAGVRLALLVSVPAIAVTLAAREALPYFGTAPAVTAEAQRYMLGRAPGLLPFLLSVALRPYLVAHGKTWPVLVAVAGGNVINLGADWLLVFGDGGLRALGLPTVGLPAMGTMGAALATTLVQFVTLLVYVSPVLGLRRELLRHAPAPAARGDELGRIVRHGVPIGLQLLAEVSSFAAAGIMAAHFGTSAAGAHSVAITLASFTFANAVGIGSATAVRVGMAMGLGGEGHLRRARHRGATGLWLGLGVMTAGALTFWQAPGLLASIFTDDPSVLAMAVPLLGVAAVFQLSDGAQAIAAGALRGAGDTRAALWANLLGHYVIGVPMSLALGFGAGMGTVGVWWGLSAGLSVTAVVLIARFWRLTRSASPA